jgi:hypothetical protein
MRDANEPTDADKLAGLPNWTREARPQANESGEYALAMTGEATEPTL